MHDATDKLKPVKYIVKRIALIGFIPMAAGTGFVVTTITLGKFGERGRREV